MKSGTGVSAENEYRARNRKAKDSANEPQDK